MCAYIWKYTNILYTNGNDQNGYIFIHAYQVIQNSETETGSKIEGYDKHVYK